MIYTINFKGTDSGAMGKAVEMALKEYFRQTAKVSKSGKVDFRRNRKCFEVKTGAGELDYLMKSSIKYVVSVPVVTVDNDSSVNILKQEGFILERETYLSILDSLGLIRSKKATDGRIVTTIQTYWNYKQGKAHSLKKYNALIDALYENSLMTLSEYIEQDGKF